MLTALSASSISDYARRLGTHSSTTGLVLRLTTLAPDIGEAILRGEEPNGLSLAWLTKTMPEDWAEQHKMILPGSL